MNIQEAYKLLGVKETISDSDLKKKYREIAKEKHPDKGGDPNEFKQINEAHQFILDYRQHPEKYRSTIDSHFVNFNDLFSNIGRVHRSAPTSDIQISLSVSFQESILGVEKAVNYSHKVPCMTCSATGGKKISNGCDGCDGFGRVVKQTGNMIFQQNCNKCYGRNVKTEKCPSCQGTQAIQKEEKGKIGVPAGVENGTQLRLEGCGDFVQLSPFGAQSTALLINILVEKDKEMQKEGDDVSSKLPLSMMEALDGKSIKVRTIFGEEEIVIPALSKNGEFIAIEAAGVKGTKGKHKVYLDIAYPNDIDKFKQYLKENS